MKTYKDIDNIVIKAFKGKGKPRKVHFTSDICLCGSRQGYEHDEHCPFPYYGCSEKTINMWETVRERRTTIEHRIEHLYNEHDITGRITIEKKFEDEFTKWKKRQEKYHKVQKEKSE